MFRILFAVQGTTEMIMRFLVLPAELWQQRPYKTRMCMYNSKCASQGMEKKKKKRSDSFGSRAMRWICLSIPYAIRRLFEMRCCKLFGAAMELGAYICPKYFFSLCTHNPRQSLGDGEKREEKLSNWKTLKIKKHGTIFMTS